MKSGTPGPFFQSARTPRRPAALPRRRRRALRSVGRRASTRLPLLLGALDASIGSGGSPPAEVMYGLLLWPWAEPLLAASTATSPRSSTTPSAPTGAATVPKTLLLETVHTLVIVDHMLQALADGKMRWALKRAPPLSGGLADRLRSSSRAPSAIATTRSRSSTSGGSAPGRGPSHTAIAAARSECRRSPRRRPEALLRLQRDLADRGPAHFRLDRELDRALGPAHLDQDAEFLRLVPLEPELRPLGGHGLA